MNYVKKIFPILIFTSLFAYQAFAKDMTKSELLEELKRMKARIEQLESLITNSKPVPMPDTVTQKKPGPGTISLADRIRKIEETIGNDADTQRWHNAITLSGSIEVEATYEKMDPAGSAPGEDTSDIALATVELGIAADIAPHVSAQAVLLWEEGDTEPVDIDEAFITLDGEERLPLYLQAGKMYLPFGNFESHFISDPLTVELGETRESAVTFGFKKELLDASVSAFNGDIDKIGRDDHINGFVVNATGSLPEGLIPNTGMFMGVSYISNIADTDGLEGETPGEVKDTVAGIGAFLSASYKDRIFLEAAYLGAVEEFEAGELSFDDGEQFQPVSWHIELACSVRDNLEVALRYEGGNDLGDFLPEIQFGATVSYGFWENTSLALEYLYGEFENDDERQVVTTQLAVSF